MSVTDKCSIPIQAGPPVYSKFRTGSYLIYDDEPSGPTHFRKGTHLKEMPFRASGSRQLNASRLEKALKSVAPSGRLYLVDLRQETHLFFDKRAVSWYADKDFGNVGQTLDWIVADEAAQLARIKALPETQLFCIKQDDQGNVSPTGYSELVVKSAKTEQDVAAKMPSSHRPKYVRIPVTDHCNPSTEALTRFVKLCISLKPGDWVHCHCHGGDGRTTTFLALFDMVHWAKSKGTTEFPTLAEFADRQCHLFSYCLKPHGCSDTGKCKDSAGDSVTKVPPTADWKYFLSLQRWWFLDLARTWIVNGGLGDGVPFSMPHDWE